MDSGLAGFAAIRNDERTFLLAGLDPYCRRWRRSLNIRQSSKKTRPSRRAPRRRGRTRRRSTIRWPTCSIPAIGQGRAGLGAQTGTRSPSPLVGEGGVGGREGKSQPSTSAKEEPSSLAHHLPTPTSISSPQRGGEEQASKLAQPPDNSWDRRADFANAHKARASVARGFRGSAAAGLCRQDSGAARRARSRSGAGLGN